MVVSERRYRPASDLTPQFLVGAGLFAFLTLAYMLATSTAVVGAVLPERLLESLLLGVPALGLIYAGYWLHTCEFSSEQLGRVGAYALAATLATELATGVALSLFPPGFLGYRTTFFLLVSTGTEGALLGVLLGVFVVTDALRRRGEELELRSERFQYVERVADIGYWELDVATGAGGDGGDAAAELVLSGGAAGLFGLPPDESVDVESYVRRHHPDDRDEVRRAVESAVVDGAAFEVEARVRRDDGTTRWVVTAGQPVARGGRVGTVRGVVQDVTERVEHERELERKNDRLGRFASVVSHDLRNPLNVAAARVRMAREDGDVDSLDDAARALDRMERLIEDVLTLAREGDAVDPEGVSLDAVAERCWDRVETGGATLRCETDRRIRADPSSLERLLGNLLRNSVEHGSTSSRPAADDIADRRSASSQNSSSSDDSVEHGSTGDRGTECSGDVVDDAPREGRPEVDGGGRAGDPTVTVGDCEGGFYVADDGPGVPPGDRERVFEMGHSTAAEGTGFGLSIVEEVATAHGWTVTATESEAGGLRVEVVGVEDA